MSMKRSKLKVQGLRFEDWQSRELCVFKKSGRAQGVGLGDAADVVYSGEQRAIAAGVAPDLHVTFPPHDMPWKVREMPLRHRDRHVFV